MAGRGRRCFPGESLSRCLMCPVVFSSLARTTRFSNWAVTRASPSRSQLAYLLILCGYNWAVRSLLRAGMCGGRGYWGLVPSCAEWLPQSCSRRAIVSRGAFDAEALAWRRTWTLRRLRVRAPRRADGAVVEGFVVVCWPISCGKLWQARGVQAQTPAGELAGVTTVFNATNMPNQTGNSLFRAVGCACWESRVDSHTASVLVLGPPTATHRSSACDARSLRPSSLCNSILTPHDIMFW